MTNDKIKKELIKVCSAKSPEYLLLSEKLNDELKFLQKYLSCEYNRLHIDKKLKEKVNKTSYTSLMGFDKWFSNRIAYYEKEWEKMIKYKGEVLKNYDFFSKTFKILKKCSWWVQNAYQLDPEPLINELDNIANTLEETIENKNILIDKSNKLCALKKNWHCLSHKMLNSKEREKERQVFSFFSELKAANELMKKSFSNVTFLKETNKKTPDIFAKQKEINAYIEVKRVQNPHDEDESFRSKNKHEGIVNSAFTVPLEKKLRDFACDAKEKFQNQNNIKNKKQKILIIDFEPGIDSRIHTHNSEPTLTNIFKPSFFIELEEEFGLTIWPRKYF